MNNPSSMERGAWTLPLISGVLAAGSWAAAHLAIHRPRGWPFDVLGEWDLLLPAHALVAGEPLPAALGAIHGPELGAYVLSWLVSLPMMFGVDGSLAAKVLALSIGGLTAGVCAAWASRLAGLRGGPRSALIAGVLVAAVWSAGWPGWHFELAGLNGRTPEALPFQLLALWLALGSGRTALRGLACGACLGSAWLLSPVALWTALGCGAALLLKPGRSAALIGVLTGGAVVFLLFGVLVPGGWEGLRLFLVEQFGGGLGVLTAGTSRATESVLPRPGPLHILMAVSGALEGGAHNQELGLRAVVLPLLGWAVVLSPGLVAARWWKNRTADSSVWLAVLAWSWLLPLSVLPLDRWFYPLAYRYWGAPLALGLVILATELGAGMGERRLARPYGSVVILLLLGTALLVPTLGQSIVAPPATTAQAVVSAGAHRMGARPGRGRHDAFVALAPHAPPSAQVPLYEGYGMALGLDLVRLFGSAEGEGTGQVQGGAAAFLKELEPVLVGLRRPALQRGIGCGLVAGGADRAQLNGWTEGMRTDDLEALRGGWVVCSPQASGSLWGVLSVPNPLQLMPERW